MPEKNGKLDTALIRELAAILREADLGEIEIEQGDLRIKVVKPEARTVHVSAPPYAVPPTAQAAAAPAAPPSGVAAGGAAMGEHPGAVKSPMVGTVYLAPEEGAANFIKVGDNVTAGQTLLLVEAMKTFNPVPAPKAGKVVQVLVQNQQPVEFGEPLVVIE